MLAQPAICTSDQAPYVLAPEQVTLLVLYGAARVREPVRNSNKTPLRDSILGAVSQEVDTAHFDNDALQEELIRTQQESSNVPERTTIDLVRIEEDESLFRWLSDFEVPVPSTREFRARELVYHDLWRKGYYLTNGQQFGCTYLAYEGLPGDVHAKFLIEFVLDDGKLSPMDMVSLVRLATQVKKSVVIAVIAPDNHQPHYVKLDWFKPYTNDYE